MSTSDLVLIIDDELLVREAMTDILELAGGRVIVAPNGREGIELFKAHRAEVGAVILDLLMPVLNGEGALRALRAIDPQVKVILSSCYDEAEVIRHLGGEEGGEKPTIFLQKPYDANTLIEAVRAVLGAGVTE
jgi:CheY-like chemotaxis protein